MRQSHIILLISCMLASVGCRDVMLPAYDQQIVVEGWIENGRPPIVILTTSVSVDGTPRDSTDLKEHIIRWGKVTVSDGEKEVVLAGKKDDRYFPPYIYTTAKIKGEVGKTYHITVEYSGRTVTSSTTIPSPVSLEYIRAEKVSDSLSPDPDKYILIGGLRDNKETKDYYKLFTKVHGEDSSFVSSFLGLTDDAVITADIEEIPINKGRMLNGKKEIHFNPGDTVSIRFCSLDKTSWEYWNDFEEIESLTSNPFFPINTDIRSNINGGLGYWNGYGSAYYTIELTESGEVREL